MEAHICSKRGKDFFLQHGARIWRSLWFVKLSVGTWKMGEDLQMQFAMSIAASNIAAVYNNARVSGHVFSQFYVMDWNWGEAKIFVSQAGYSTSDLQ